MPEHFPILKITPEMRGSMEPLGSKPKFWFRYQEQKWLFKEARENTGEDWAEKAASEIAALLGLPTHHAELANYGEKRGCAVRSFLEGGHVLVHGNELLGGIVANYDKEKHRGQSDHTFENIVMAINALFPLGKQRDQASLLMAGYVVFDALVGNTDRHHQNWGIVLKSELVDGKPHLIIRLAPTFDHASSLGRELTDDTRERHLREKTIARYIRNGRGGIFDSSGGKHGMSPIALAEKLSRSYPNLFKHWQAKVAGLDKNKVDDIFRRLPESRTSPITRQFALAFLIESSSLLQFL